jgi:hypothetical protein
VAVATILPKQVDFSLRVSYPWLSFNVVIPQLLVLSNAEEVCILCQYSYFVEIRSTEGSHTNVVKSCSDQFLSSTEYLTEKRATCYFKAMIAGNSEITLH